MGQSGTAVAGTLSFLEATAQLTRALAQIALLPGTPSLRREELKLQVALITPLMHIQGYATPETKAALGEARSLIEKAEALGDLPEDPLLLFSILYGFWVVNFVAFNGDAVRDLSEQFLALAEKQGTAAGPLLVARRLMGISPVNTGDLVEGRAQLDKAAALYVRAEHSPLATRFGQDVRRE